MRMSDWSSDVCSSDLLAEARADPFRFVGRTPVHQVPHDRRFDRADANQLPAARPESRAAGDASSGFRLAVNGVVEQLQVELEQRGQQLKSVIGRDGKATAKSSNLPSSLSGKIAVIGSGIVLPGNPDI